jgi:hypothetical protein
VRAVESSSLTAAAPPVAAALPHEPDATFAPQEELVE